MLTTIPPIQGALQLDIGPALVDVQEARQRHRDLRAALRSCEALRDIAARRRQDEAAAVRALLNPFRLTPLEEINP
jgi:hypothetical protein